ncbi:MAG: outer membrane lipoprotein-sorting protein [Thermodesulfobacteriota bacterium]
MKKIFALMLLIVILGFASSAFAGVPTQSGVGRPEEIMKKSQDAFYYPGADFKARITMKLGGKGGQERIRELTMIRKNYGKSGGEQKYFIYFFQPSDVRDMTFMVYKYPEKDDDRWLFLPAINMVRRIAAQDKRSSFAGSDFTYEDVSGRDIEDDTHAIVKEDKLDGKDVYLVKSEPKAKDSEFSKKLSWIDKTNFLPLKEEYYDRKDELVKIFTADEIKNVKGFPTVMKRTMKNLKTQHSSEATFTKVDYNMGIEDSLFSERFLKNPPKKSIE